MNEAVLIAGDDAPAAEALAACAMQEGLRPLQACSVAQAIRLARRERPVLALVEHRLAGEHPIAIGLLHADYRCPVALWIAGGRGRG